MENKTAEEILRPYTVKCSFQNNSKSESQIVSAMKDYAEQEVKKHLEMAKDKVLLYRDKSAIANIKIDLT